MIPGGDFNRLLPGIYWHFGNHLCINDFIPVAQSVKKKLISVNYSDPECLKMLYYHASKPTNSGCLTIYSQAGVLMKICYICRLY
jgi:hypothetical protein